MSNGSGRYRVCLVHLCVRARRCRSLLRQSQVWRPWLDCLVVVNSGFEVEFNETDHEELGYEHMGDSQSGRLISRELIVHDYE